SESCSKPVNLYVPEWSPRPAILGTIRRFAEPLAFGVRGGRATAAPNLTFRVAQRMTAVICGSLAYDTIMVFQDQFKNHIIPDQVHILNVSFLVPAMRREFGG